MYFVHAMVTPFFRWVVMCDLDEIIIPWPSYKKKKRLVTQGAADEVLDSMDAAFEPRWAGYMNFRLKHITKQLRLRIQ